MGHCILRDWSFHDSVIVQYTPACWSLQAYVIDHYTATFWSLQRSLFGIRLCIRQYSYWPVHVYIIGLYSSGLCDTHFREFYTYTPGLLSVTLGITRRWVLTLQDKGTPNPSSVAPGPSWVVVGQGTHLPQCSLNRRNPVPRPHNDASNQSWGHHVSLGQGTGNRVM